MPVLEGKVPGTGHTVSQHPKDDLGMGATVRTENGNAKSGKLVYEEGQAGRGAEVERAGTGSDAGTYGGEGMSFFLFYSHSRTYPHLCPQTC
jgi:hypothetical protein